MKAREDLSQCCPSAPPLPAQFLHPSTLAVALAVPLLLLLLLLLHLLLVLLLLLMLLALLLLLFLLFAYSFKGAHYFVILEGSCFPCPIVSSQAFLHIPGTGMRYAWILVRWSLHHLCCSSEYSVNFVHINASQSPREFGRGSNKVSMSTAYQHIYVLRTDGSRCSKMLLAI